MFFSSTHAFSFCRFLLRCDRFVFVWSEEIVPKSSRICPARYQFYRRAGEITRLSWNDTCYCQFYQHSSHWTEEYIKWCHCWRHVKSINIFGVNSIKNICRKSKEKAFNEERQIRCYFWRSVFQCCEIQ